MIFKITLTIFTIAIVITGVIAQEQEQYHLLKKGNIADIYTDKVLFENNDKKSFFVKFIIVNKTEKKIGAQLDDYFSLYPNQWLIHLKNYEVFTFEKLMEPEELDLAKKDELRFDYEFKKLSMISPRDTLIFYKQFGAKNRKDLQLKKDEYLTINFDGQLFLTDGKALFEVVDTYNDDSVNREMTIKNPINWKTIPENGLVIYYKKD